MSYYLFTTSPSGAVAGRFETEFQDLGTELRVISPEDSVVVPAGSVVLPRIAPEQNSQAITKLRQYSNARIINPPDTWEISRDKAKAAEVFARHSIPTPITVSVKGRAYEELSSQLGLPFIVKVIDGTHGQGVHLVKTPEDFTKHLHEHTGTELIAQPFIAEAAGADIRLIVVGNAVVAAMTRQAAKGEFRSNLHLGGDASPYQPTADETALAVSASKAVGLEISGVDCIRSAGGLLVLEVNPSPGLWIEKITGVNVAQAMAQYALTQGASALQPSR